ncbi:MAG TPA: hypothetical protein VND20_01885 [Candidatus Binataceae bacterium]|nr:hypothetical protein [Candidatus Binataceae bacterium]
MKNPLRLIVIGALLFVPLISASRVQAQVDPWEFEVYPYATQSRGTAELESDNAVIANGHSHGGEGTAAGIFRSQGMWYNQYEFTYGLTDRIEAAAYLLMASPDGHGYWYAGSEYRLRGRLFDPDVLPVDLGWYAEIEWHQAPQFDSADAEIELRPIIEKDLGQFSLMVNPVFEKVLAGVGTKQGFEFGYSTAAYYRWTRYLSPGLEFYGATGLIDDTVPLSQQQHYIFPVLWGELPHGIEYNFGPGFGLTRGSDHVIVKFNLEVESFVGAVFGPSSDNGWFF